MHLLAPGASQGTLEEDTPKGVVPFLYPGSRTGAISITVPFKTFQAFKGLQRLSKATQTILTSSLTPDPNLPRTCHSGPYYRAGVALVIGNLDDCTDICIRLVYSELRFWILRVW